MSSLPSVLRMNMQASSGFYHSQRANFSWPQNEASRPDPSAFWRKTKRVNLTVEQQLCCSQTESRGKRNFLFSKPLFIKISLFWSPPHHHHRRLASPAQELALEPIFLPFARQFIKEFGVSAASISSSSTQFSKEHSDFSGSNYSRNG